jgi:hypothetical protein
LRSTPPRRTASSREIAAAWTALRDYLARLGRELSDEVRHYPSPIARCDVQLTKLIEERTRAIEQLRVLTGSDPRRSQGALASLESLLVQPQVHPDDELEGAIRSRLSAAIEALRGGGTTHEPAPQRGRTTPREDTPAPTPRRSRSIH